MNENKKQFGRAMVYSEPRDIPFTAKITSKIHEAIKEETARRVSLSSEADPRLQFKAAQLGYEILKEWHDDFQLRKENPDLVNETAHNALKEAYRNLKVNYERILSTNDLQTESENVRYSVLFDENQKLKADLENALKSKNTLQTVTDTGQMHLEVERLNVEVLKYKTMLKEIGAAIHNVTGYYYNKAFSELKSKLILIITNL
jgi:hypothetical protein